MAEATERETDSTYEAPALVAYGTVEEWTLGRFGSGIIISVVI